MASQITVTQFPKQTIGCETSLRTLSPGVKGKNDLAQLWSHFASH